MSQRSPSRLRLQDKTPSQEARTDPESSRGDELGWSQAAPVPWGHFGSLSLWLGEVTVPWASHESETHSFLFSHRHPNGSKRRQTENNLNFRFLFFF